MTERKWTPGPWEWVKPKHWPKHEENEGDLGHFIGADGAYLFGFGSNDTYYNCAGDPPEKANANLIAAAPDLYDALEKLLEFVEAHTESGEVIPPYTVEHVRTRAALAKARGEK